jgi:hypothetical protein
VRPLVRIRSTALLAAITIAAAATNIIPLDPPTSRYAKSMLPSKYATAILDRTAAFSVGNPPELGMPRKRFGGEHCNGVWHISLTELVSLYLFLHLRWRIRGTPEDARPWSLCNSAGRWSKYLRVARFLMIRLNIASHHMTPRSLGEPASSVAGIHAQTCGMNGQATETTAPPQPMRLKFIQARPGRLVGKLPAQYRMRRGCRHCP